MKIDAETAPQIQELESKIRLIQHDKRNAPNFELKNELSQKIQGIQTNIDDIKDNKVGSKNTVRRIDYGVEVIDANTHAQHTMKLTGNHQGSLQFLLWTLSKLPLFRVGGGRAFNYGEVEPLWSITEHSFSHPEGLEVGEVGWMDGKFKLSLNGDLQFDLKDFEKSLVDQEIFNFKIFG